ncbi:hypothetical protein [Psychrobacter sp. I-STPA10]|uniref:hypothetical protein n=1 Tax=Psychrobacter sp. I-STPA10 TaxID=2585769 RepID=UPI001E3C8795|nr:hypothetical protein [Psychrobacter sp. I-STPA10]
MTLEQRIINLATAIGADVKALKANDGDLSSLSTTAKTDIVSAINEIYTLANAPNGAQIDDTATDGATTVVWSADKVHDAILEAKNALKGELTAGAGDALDTLKELGDALGNDASFATTVANDLAKRVRVDSVQTFTASEKKQGCANLGVGNPDHDFVSDYNTAKGA